MVEDEQSSISHHATNGPEPCPPKGGLVSDDEGMIVEEKDCGISRMLTVCDLFSFFGLPMAIGVVVG